MVSTHDPSAEKSRALRRPRRSAAEVMTTARRMPTRTAARVSPWALFVAPN
jgi:hypothetical protein